MLLLWFLASGVAVQLKVTPASAQLHVSGSVLTPRFGTQLFVRPGRYTLRAQAPGYQPQNYAFAVNGQAGQVVALQLRKLPGKVRVNLAAPGTLQVDAGSAVSVPAMVEMAAGKHTVLIEVEGYLPYRGELAVQGEGKMQNFAPRLMANSATVAISSEPSGAQVLIDTRAGGYYAPQCQACRDHPSPGAALGRFQTLDYGFVGQGWRTADDWPSASWVARCIADGAQHPSGCPRHGRRGVPRRDAIATDIAAGGQHGPVAGAAGPRRCDAYGQAAPRRE